MLQFSSCKRWFEVILRRIYYVISCVSPQLGVVGANCFHPKRAFDSSYSWNVHCFQIRWRICHSIGIGIKGSWRNGVNAAMNPVSIVAGCSRRQFFFICQCNLPYKGCLPNELILKTWLLCNLPYKGCLPKELILKTWLLCT